MDTMDTDGPMFPTFNRHTKRNKPTYNNLPNREEGLGTYTHYFNNPVSTVSFTTLPPGQRTPVPLVQANQFNPTCTNPHLQRILQPANQQIHNS